MKKRNSLTKIVLGSAVIFTTTYAVEEKINVHEYIKTKVEVKKKCPNCTKQKMCATCLAKKEVKIKCPNCTKQKMCATCLAKKQIKKKAMKSSSCGNCGGKMKKSDHKGNGCSGKMGKGSSCGTN